MTVSSVQNHLSPSFPVMADLIGHLRHARLRPGIYTENKMDYDLLIEMK